MKADRKLQCTTKHTHNFEPGRFKSFMQNVGRNVFLFLDPKDYVQDLRDKISMLA